MNIEDTEIGFQESADANAVRTDRFIAITTMSGRGLLYRDPRVPIQTLEPNTSAAELGAALRQALLKSDPIVKNPKELNRDAMNSHQLTWETEIIKSRGYNSRRDFQQEMISCPVSKRGNLIKIRPTLRDGSDSWVGLTNISPIELDAHCSDEALGNGLLAAFQLCKLQVE